MRKGTRWLSLLVLSLSLAVGQRAAARCGNLDLAACPQPFDAALPAAKDMLSWDQPTRLIGFRNTYRLYRGDVFHAGSGPAHPLPPAIQPLPAVRYSMDSEQYGVDDYLQRESVAGLLILKNGRVEYEYYGAGNTPKTLWTSRSVAKSVVSVLVGIALQEKLIGSVDDSVTRYLPDLQGTVWSDVTVRNLLQHTSGVAWNEDYADPASDFAHMTRCEAEARPYECVFALISSLQRRAGVKPGAVWSYNTGGAWLLGRILEKASGMTLASFLETRVWSRFAMQDDGVWEALVEGGVDMGGHGFNATLRDWGRFALFVADGGVLPGGERLLPTDWLQQSTTWTRATGSITPATPNGQFGYQWWSVGVDPRRAGAAGVNRNLRHTFWAEGIYGQVIAIDPDEKLVMVQWSTWKQADTPDALYDEQALFVDAVARALHRPR